MNKNPSDVINVTYEFLDMGDDSELCNYKMFCFSFSMKPFSRETYERDIVQCNTKK